MTSCKNIAFISSLLTLLTAKAVFGLPGQEAHGINDFAILVERLNQTRACLNELPNEAAEYLKDFTTQDEKIIAEINSNDEVDVLLYTMAYKLNSANSVSLRVLKVQTLERAKCVYGSLRQEITYDWNSLIEKQDESQPDFKFSEIWTITKISMDDEGLRITLKNSMTDESRTTKKIQISNDYTLF